MNYADLENKTAVVTGASGTIGRAVCRRLADEGMRLVLSGRDPERIKTAVVECSDRGAQAVALNHDIGKPETSEKLCRLALDRFDRLDVVINCAGAVLEAPLGILEDEEIQKLISANILGLTWMTRAALKPMLKQRSGTIINFSSVLAKRPGPGNAVYAGTKGYVESFTRAMAAELGRKNIRVNAIAPGLIDTPMTRPVMQLAGPDILKKIGLNRPGTVQEVADVVAFLASEEAAYIHGTVIAVDGGF